jgi:magnesium-transporting ATPase (P-type)
MKKASLLISYLYHQVYTVECALWKLLAWTGKLYNTLRLPSSETNLKIKRAIPATKHMKKEELDTLSNATIECEKPNKHLYKFEGRITIDNQEAISLDIENLLLRGSSLRNTGHVFGIVIFTGHEAKLMQNMSASPHKISQVERKTNRFIFFILALLIGFCLLCTIGIIIWHVVAGPEWWYLHYDESVEGRSAAAAAWLGFKSFWTFFILFNNLIPISLFVSMEFSKYAQGYLIGKDLAMYHEESDTPARVQNSALNEEVSIPA